MFPDSKIAEGFVSGRTKTTAIAKYSLASALNTEEIKECQLSPCTVLCDSGNDQMYKKYFAIMVQYWSDAAHQSATRFLAMSICSVSTAEVFFDALALELKSHGIPWSNNCNKICF